MKNKKLTKVLKKMTTAAILSIALASPLTAKSASAATYNAADYFPAGTDASVIPTEDMYRDNYNSYFRNFKNRSANIYINDKTVKKVFQKAAKAWAPVFKFKFVSSAKHADFNSAKYANVVVKKDGGAQTNWATVNKAQLFSGSMKTLKQIKKDFPTYYRLKGGLV